MKISELLRILRAKKKEHGDLEIRVYDYSWQAYYNIDVGYIEKTTNEGDDFLCLNTPSD